MSQGHVNNISRNEERCRMLLHKTVAHVRGQMGGIEEEVLRRPGNGLLPSVEGWSRRQSICVSRQAGSGRSCEQGPDVLVLKKMMVESRKCFLIGAGIRTEKIRPRAGFPTPSLPLTNVNYSNVLFNRSSRCVCANPKLLVIGLRCRQGLRYFNIFQRATS